MSDPIKMMYVQLSSAALREFLGMPEEAELVGAWMEPYQHDVLRLSVRGFGKPVREGSIIEQGYIVATNNSIGGVALKPVLTWEPPA